MLLKGNGAAALDRYAAAARIRLPESLMVRMVAGYRAVGRPDGAEKLVEHFLAGHPDSAIAARLLAEHAAQAGDWRRAAMLLRNLKARGGDRDLRLLTDLSLAQLRSGNARAAAATAGQAYALQPMSPLAAQAYGLGLAALGQRPNTARSLLAQAYQALGETGLSAEARRRLAAYRRS